MIAKDISEVSGWLHNINSTKPEAIKGADIGEMEEKATRVQEFIVSLYQYMDEIER